MRYQGWDEILMILLISSKKLGVYKIMRDTVRQLTNQSLYMSLNQVYESLDNMHDCCGMTDNIIVFQSLFCTLMGS